MLCSTVLSCGCPVTERGFHFGHNSGDTVKTGSDFQRNFFFFWESEIVLYILPRNWCIKRFTQLIFKFCMYGSVAKEDIFAVSISVFELNTTKQTLTLNLNIAFI